MEERSVKKLNGHYALINGLHWGGYAVLWGSLSVILLSYGFNNTQVGLVSALALVLPLLIQPPLSAACDRSARLTDRRVLLFTSAAALAIGAVLDITAGSSQFLMAALFVCLGTILTLMPPFHNAMAMEFVAGGIPLNYGLGRGIGSVSYAAAILLIGRAIEDHGARIPLHVFLLCIAGGLVSTFLFRWKCPAAGAAAEAEDSEKLGLLSFLKKYPRYTQTLLACTLLMSAHSATVTYMYQIMGKVGAQTASMGIALGIGAAMELPAMCLFDRFRRRFGLPKIFCVSAAVFVLRVVLLLSATSVTTVYLTMLTQFLSFGLYQPATVYYAAKAIPARHRSEGQALIHVFPSGLGSALGSFFCGWLLDRWGVNGMLLFPLACAAGGFALLCPVMKKEANAK